MNEKFALLCAAFSLFAGCAGPIAESGGEPAQASPFTVAAAEPIHELQQMTSITQKPALLQLILCVITGGVIYVSALLCLEYKRARSTVAWVRAQLKKS